MRENVMGRLETIYRYPIKGCRGVRVEAADVTTSGLVGDRQWVLVNGQGVVNQKILPDLRFLEVAESETGLIISLKGWGSIGVDESLIEPTASIQSIGREVPCVRAGGAVSDWLSNAFGQPLQLVRATSGVPLSLDGTPFQQLHGSTQSAFVDIAPILIVGLESLTDLNDRVDQASRAGSKQSQPVASGDRPVVRVEQFRPNLVISGLPAYTEETAETLQIGPMSFSRLVACERCSVTTFDPFGERNSKEPLKTLSQYRRDGVGYAGGVTFGGYYVPQVPGRLAQGDEIY